MLVRDDGGRNHMVQLAPRQQQHELGCAQLGYGFCHSSLQGPNERPNNDSDDAAEGKSNWHRRETK